MMKAKSRNRVSEIDAGRLAESLSVLAAGIPGLAGAPIIEMHNSLLIMLPDWAGQTGLAALTPEEPGQETCYILLCEPLSEYTQHDAFASSENPVKNLAGQAILDLPVGMWSIRTVDFRDGRTIAVETARGRPVVCGLFSPGGPVILLFQRISG